MLNLHTSSGTHTAARLITSFARTESEIEEAQRLRYKVFAEEMGARLPSAKEELDRDIFDPHCQHLLVRESDENRVVGTYRLLPPEQALKIGGYYSQTEFDLTRLMHLRNRMVEVGRSCVHPDFRDGRVITQLWGGLARYMLQNGYEYLIGCASISMSDGGHVAASLYRKLHRVYGAPVEYHAFPRYPLPLEVLNPHLDAPLPPLIKGYLRLGTYLCSAPAWDPEFNTADLLMLLPLSRMNPRYAQHFLKSGQA